MRELGSLREGWEAVEAVETRSLRSMTTVPVGVCQRQPQPDGQI
jgi:hypothetical protein